MHQPPQQPTQQDDGGDPHPEHFDVIVVGAGISGIDAGYHLQKFCPTRSFLILEGRDDIGGTWDLFRYPGIRSDSDMHTLGFGFKPWNAEKAIADGPSILAYLRETVAENDLGRRIRFGHHVSRADWSSADARWTLTATRRSDAAAVKLTCNYLFMCSGYYSYRGGYEPDLPGRDLFGGPIVHPQQWPEDLDYRGKEVVVIGSGATAMTIVPSMAPTAAHVTMLQRSPTYVIDRPDVDRLANLMRKVLPDRVAYAITRAKNTALQQLVYRWSRRRPDQLRALLIGQVRRALGADYDVGRHFTPRYDPWDERLCLIPNGDLFTAIRSGKASVVTDRIKTFTADGIRLESGEELHADIVVTATGLKLVTLGEMDFTVDGAPVDFADSWTYKGFAYSDVPNLASSFGYVNASWTLRADLICDYVCRLLNHMETIGADICTPRLRDADRSMTPRPWIDGFSPGYIKREMHRFPKQGDHAPWINPQRLRADRRMFRKDPIDDGAMRFERAPRRARSADPAGPTGTAEAVAS